MTQTDSQPASDDFRLNAEYQAAHNFLVGRINYERFAKMPYSRKELNLDRMARLLDLLGNPHLQTNVVHVAGTKGKGSTAAFISSAIQAQGLRCGSYTSPHLHHIEERFRLGGQPCSPQTFTKIVQQIEPIIDGLDARGEDVVTYFEIATAIGFLFFLHEKVDLAVVEVGLGGRLDSTNVCKPLVSVITSISFDHMKQLGNTLSLIAAEKAGIIKPNVPVVSGVTEAEPRNVIREIAKQSNAKLVERNTHFRFANYRAGDIASPTIVNFDTCSDNTWQPALQDLELGNRGQHQAANASVAWAVLELLPEHLRPSSSSLRQGFAMTSCDARAEVLAREPLVILDVAHNPASAQALVDTLDEFGPATSRRLILATTRGKDVEKMLRIMLPHFDQVVCTRYRNNPRGHAVTDLVRLAESAKQELGCDVEITSYATPTQAWQFVRESSQPSDRICIAGSFFIAAELRDMARGPEPSN